MSKESSTMSSVPDPTEYNVSYQYGFLYPDPLTKLPDYFEPWNEIGLNLCELVEKKKLKQAVDEMPLLDHTLLSGEREKYCAYTLLSFTCNAYVWGDRDNYIPEVLPEQLAVPLYELSESLGLQPLLTYAAFASFNWKLKDPEQPFLPDGNLDCIVKLPKHDEFQWFCIISCYVEKVFAPAVKAIHDGMCSVVNSDISGVIKSLDILSDTVWKMKIALSRMHENLTADGFNHVVRPFLFGFGGPRSLLQEGLVYEGISDDPVTKIGQSAAQSCTFQCMDAALGVVHDAERKKILLLLRSYMRPEHARYIEALENGPSIKEFVIRENNHELTQSYNNTVDTLTKFRTYHVQVVAKFIVVPAAKAKTKGTTLMPWLKGLRENTESSKLPPKDDSKAQTDFNMNILKQQTDDVEPTRGSYCPLFCTLMPWLKSLRDGTKSSKLTPNDDSKAQTDVNRNIQKQQTDEIEQQMKSTLEVK